MSITRACPNFMSCKCETRTENTKPLKIPKLVKNHINELNEMWKFLNSRQ